jgi:F420-dependent oxidoreductase-like protein
VKTAITISGPASGQRRDFEQVVDFVVEAEKLGVDQAWSAEAWGMDAVAPLAYLGARTRSIELGTGIMQISARAPAMTAMTASTMAAITGDRFLLGLGTSGPQVVEGLHGSAFAQPLVRMRETIEIVRMALRGEKVNYHGKAHVLPRPGGQGKALRLSLAPNPNIPIYLATLAPKALELTGELADGWLGGCFVPEHPEAHLKYLRRGAAKAGRDLSELAICVGSTVAFTDDPGPLVEASKQTLAFVLGGMGSPITNFYNDAYKRGGFVDAAVEVQRLWVEGKRTEAASRVPDEMILQTSLIGSEEYLRERIRKYRDLGIAILRLDPVGKTTSERLDTLGRAVEIVKQET